MKLKPISHEKARVIHLYPCEEKTPQIANKTGKCFTTPARRRIITKTP